MSYSIILFSNFFFHFLETILTLKIFNNFWYCKILIFQIVKFWKFVNFLNWAIIAILGNWLMFRIKIFWNFINSKFLEFYELEILGIFLVGKLTNFQNFFNLENYRNSFDIPYYSQFLRFSYLLFDINEFRRFIFSIFIFYCSYSRKFGHSTFQPFVNFQIRNVSDSTIWRFEILTLTHLFIEIKKAHIWTERKEENSIIFSV